MEGRADRPGPEPAAAGLEARPGHAVIQGIRPEHRPIREGGLPMVVDVVAPGERLPVHWDRRQAHLFDQVTKRFSLAAIRRRAGLSRAARAPAREAED